MVGEYRSVGIGEYSVEYLAKGYSAQHPVSAVHCDSNLGQVQIAPAPFYGSKFFAQAESRGPMKDAGWCSGPVLVDVFSHL